MKNWPITLPMYPPEEVLDNSTISEYQRCPRRALYKYGLRRGWDSPSYSIAFGTAYHTYREILERYLQQEVPETRAHELALEVALTDFEDPPLEHRDAFLDSARLTASCLLAFKRVKQERHLGQIVVTRQEDSFDLELDFWLCPSCAWVQWHESPCERCGSSLFKPRHGGRVDQFVKFHGRQDMIRDFKTTKYKGRTYEAKFDPNAQIQGYVWAGGRLSGRRFDGALIETVYNTSTKGPEISQTLVSFSPGQLAAWQQSIAHERASILSYWNRAPEEGYLAFPQRTTACQDFGGCRYVEACRSGSAKELEAWLRNYTVYSHWDFAANNDST